MVDLIEAEGCARHIMQLAGFDPDEPCSIRRLAEQTPGIAGIYTGRGLRLRKDCALFTLNGERWIARRSGISTARAKFGVAHELAEHYLHGQVREDIETMCNAIAGAIVMPRKAFARALREVGENLDALSELFDVTKTAAALRLGEVTQMPMVVMTPTWIWVRGADFAWPDEAQIRREARAPRPGLRKIHIEPRRLALAVNDEMASD